jgi:hypothetical protein
MYEVKWRAEDFWHFFLFTKIEMFQKYCRFYNFVITGGAYWFGIGLTSDFKSVESANLLLTHRYLVHSLVLVPGTFFGAGSWHILWHRYLVHSLVLRCTGGPSTGRSCTPVPAATTPPRSRAISANTSAPYTKRYSKPLCCQPVLCIRDHCLTDRIRSWSFRRSSCQQKIFFFAYYGFEDTLTLFFEDKSRIEVTKQ